MELKIFFNSSKLKFKEL